MSAIIEQDWKEKLKSTMKEVSNSIARIEGEREYIKEVVNKTSETYGIEKKVLRKLFKVFHKQNFEDEVHTSEEFQELYERITK